MNSRWQWFKIYVESTVMLMDFILFIYFKYILFKIAIFYSMIHVNYPSPLVHSLLENGKCQVRWLWKMHLPIKRMRTCRECSHLLTFHIAGFHSIWKFRHDDAVAKHQRPLAIFHGNIQAKSVKFNVSKFHIHLFYQMNRNNKLKLTFVLRFLFNFYLLGLFQ